MARARVVGRTLATVPLSRAAGQLLLAILLVASVVSLASAQSIAPPSEGWSEPERWAWEQIRAGRIADFNAREGEEALDPRKPGDWDEGRRLSAGFLKEILFREPYREAIPVEGVRIVGAWFPEAVDLANGRLDRQLWLDKCRFGGEVNLTALRVNGWLSLEGSATAERSAEPAPVRLYGAEINGSIYLDKIMFGDVDLESARITGQLTIQDATVNGALDMRGLEVRQFLLMRGGTFRDADLGSARIGHQIDMSGITVNGALDMGSIEIGQHLLMRGGTFRDADLGSARIGHQVDMSGITVNGALDMRGLEVRQFLLMRGGTFRDANLGSARIGTQVDMSITTVNGALDMRGLEVGQSLLMRGGTFQDVGLVSARIGHQVDMRGITVNGALDMDSIEVGQHLLMRGGIFHELNLQTARIARQLDLRGAKGRGLLNMRGLEVGQHLLMGDRATFRDVELANAQIAGQLSMSGAVVTGQLGMDGLEVEQTLFMREARFEKQVDLVYAHIESNLQLSGADFSGAGFTELDLSATRIEGELDLGSGAAPAPRWREGASLTLRDTHAGALRDRPDAWEGLELQLDGFTYGRLGGFVSVAADVPARGIGWYIAWLARDPSYTPQPYEHLAAVFREAGEATKANRILYESRERARGQAWQQGECARWLGLSLLKWVIWYGLGLGYFLAFVWIALFTLIGTAVLEAHRQGPAHLSAKAFFSLDRLVPRLVQLDKTHDDIEAGLTGWVRRYFYLHKVVGYVLAGFLLAGLAGLTQR